MDACDHPSSMPEPKDQQLVADDDKTEKVEFTPPSISGLSPSVVIEYCDRCRWLHRASWVSTELLLTFPPPTLRGVTLIPLNDADTAGRFRVWVHRDEGYHSATAIEGGKGQDRNQKLVLMWDRKTEGGFPELKALKQRIRDCVDPGRALGHSDKGS